MPSVTAGALFSYDMARHRGACLYFDGVRHGVPDDVLLWSIALFSLSTSLAVPGAVDDDVFPRQVMESIASSFLCRPASGWIPGEVNAADSHEHAKESLIAAAPT